MNNRKIKAKEFAEFWKNKGYEKGESQSFWLSLLRNVFGISEPEKYILFEEQVHLDHTSFIDGYIPTTHVLIEQKGLGKDLLKSIKQSDGSLLTPFQQAQRYSAVLPYSQRPRWIITCNFSEFLIYDMEKPNGEPERLLLKDLPKEYYRLNFLVDTEDQNIKQEMEISIQAGEIVGKLYDEILKQYINPQSEETLKSLNQLCVRLVFCLYAEDAEIFGGHNKFHNYISSFTAKDMRRALIDLFKILDTKEEDRDPYTDEILSQFPYVNGGLFADENIEIPQMNDTIREMLLEKASEDFDWSNISPTIFGAVFESTLNPETRRSGGMHYTSIENIHKVIDPLFLDELKNELEEIKALKTAKIRDEKLNAFQKKLSSLDFLDPACGSGNFLTETYISLRRLENEALKIRYGSQITLGDANANPVKVSIGQFYGIEINDFATTVAKTALWIAESQMLKQTEDIVHTTLDFLPLKSYANIVEGNALRMDWNEVVPVEKLDYIMGNPPFVGGMMATKDQKSDIERIFGKIKGVGELDYVSGWYKKASEMMINNKNIKTAFVSTNSICQGQQAVTLWKPLFNMNVQIIFAHRTFKWNSEASEKAAVHCVIVGFHATQCPLRLSGGSLPQVSRGDINSKNEQDIPINPSTASGPPPFRAREALGNIEKYIFTDNRPIKAKNINPYLVDAPTIFVESRNSPLCDIPDMRFGSMPRDGGGFVLTDEEKSELTAKEPLAEKWIHKYMGAYEFINNKSRWCLWLVNANPNELKKCSLIMKRIEAIREFRANSAAAGTRKFAATPTLFCQIAQPDTDYLIIPRVSSENRKYVPIGFMPPNVIASDAVQLIPNATLYHFGILTSNVHMTWMRAVCGRLKSDYRYSKDIVYNNFPWCEPTAEQKAKIEETAQAILDARSLYPDSSLADLYDELTMPPELRKAHQANDKAVMQAYGFPIKNFSESDCVSSLMQMYQKIISNEK